MINDLFEPHDSATLEQIFNDWIEYLIYIGQIKRENINYKMLNQAIVELEKEQYVKSGRKLH